jgi:hypothetical protein
MREMTTIRASLAGIPTLLGWNSHRVRLYLNLLPEGRAFVFSENKVVSELKDYIQVYTVEIARPRGVCPGLKFRSSGPKVWTEATLCVDDGNVLCTRVDKLGEKTIIYEGHISNSIAPSNLDTVLRTLWAVCCLNFCVQLFYSYGAVIVVKGRLKGQKVPTVIPSFYFRDICLNICDNCKPPAGIPLYIYGMNSPYGEFLRYLNTVDMSAQIKCTSRNTASNLLPRDVAINWADNKISFNLPQLNAEGEVINLKSSEIVNLGVTIKGELMVLSLHY